MKQHAPFPAPPHPALFLIPLGEKGLNICFDLLCNLRHEGIACEIDLSAKKVQYGLALASALGAEYALIIGEDEINSRRASLKNLTTRQSQEIPLDALLENMKRLVYKT